MFIPVDAADERKNCPGTPSQLEHSPTNSVKVDPLAYDYLAEQEYPLLLGGILPIKISGDRPSS